MTPSVSSLRLLIDECSQSHELVRALIDAGYDVLTVDQAGLTHLPDSEVLAFAIAHERIILTRNDTDFRRLHEVNSNHFGIFTVRFERDRSKRLTVDEVIRAIQNINNSGCGIAGELAVLNNWLY